MAARVEATLLVLHIIGHDSEMLRRGAGTWDIIGKTTKLEDIAIRSARYGGPQYVPQMVQVDVLAQAQRELQKWLHSQLHDQVAEARVEEG